MHDSSVYICLLSVRLRVSRALGHELKFLKWWQQWSENSLLHLQEAGLVDQRAGETEQELWSSVETHRLHRGPDGRAASRSRRLGQEKREKGMMAQHFRSCSYSLMRASTVCCMQRSHVYTAKYYSRGKMTSNNEKTCIKRINQWK